MLTVKTYFKIENEFILIEKYDGPLVGGIDSDFEDFEGAIELAINGRVLMKKPDWDYVDQLWRVVLNGLANICLDKDFHGCYPDQAIEIRFSKADGSRINLSIKSDSEVRVTVNMDELFEALLDEASKFFRRLENLVGVQNYKNDLRVIEAIRTEDLAFLKQSFF